MAISLSLFSYEMSFLICTDRFYEGLGGYLGFVFYLFTALAGFEPKILCLLKIAVFYKTRQFVVDCAGFVFSH